MILVFTRVFCVTETKVNVQYNGMFNRHAEADY